MYGKIFGTVLIIVDNQLKGDHNKADVAANESVSWLQLYENKKLAERPNFVFSILTFEQEDLHIL